MNGDINGDITRNINGNIFCGCSPPVLCAVLQNGRALPSFLLLLCVLPGIKALPRNYALSDLSIGDIPQLLRLCDEDCIDTIGALCPVCLEPFTTAPPLMLDCAHTVCANCIGLMADKVLPSVPPLQSTLFAAQQAPFFGGTGAGRTRSGAQVSRTIPPPPAR